MAPNSYGGLNVTGSNINTALHLIQQHNGTCEVGLEAVKVLESMREPIAVVSIAGITRQGKSYILNRLTNTAGGFKVSHTVNPCTRDMWMWPQPVEVAGKRHKLVFLDTEGVASSAQTSASDAVLVSLAGLVSSLLIYNNKGTFDEYCINTLSQVAATLKTLDTKSDEASKQATSTTKPGLLILLRDYALQSNGTMSDMVEKALDDQELTGWNIKAIQSRNNARALIKEVFTQRMCHALPHPHCDTTELEVIPDHKISKQFQEGIRDLSDLVFSTAVPKMFNGVVMTGPVMVQLLQAAVEAANSGATPVLADIWASIEATELAAATKQALSAYQDSAAANELAACRTIPTAKYVHKVALKAARAALERQINLASTSSQVKTWSLIIIQLESRFQLVLESIRRLQAEAEVELHELLQRAKTAALKAFDQDGFLETCRLEANKAEEAFREHSQAALKAFDAATTAVKNSGIAINQVAIQKGIVSAESEVVATLKAAFQLAQEKLKALKAEKEAQHVAAAKKQLEDQQRLEKLQQVAVEKAVQEYKARMQNIAATSTDAELLEEEHKKLLTELASLPEYGPNGLTTMGKSEAASRITTLCEKLHAVYIRQVQQRKAEQEEMAVEDAANKALDLYKHSVAMIESNCVDKSKARDACEGARKAAVFMFKGLIPEGCSSFNKQQQFSDQMTRLEGLIWDRVCQNAARAEQLEKQKREAAAELAKQQREAAARLKQEQDAAAAALRRQRELEDQRRRLQAAEDERRLQAAAAAAAAAEAARQQRLQQEAYDRRLQQEYERQRRQEEYECQRWREYEPCRTCYPRTYYGEPADPCPRSSRSGREHRGVEGNTYRTNSHGIAITQQGELCSNCAAGYRCRWHKRH